MWKTAQRMGPDFIIEKILKVRKYKRQMSEERSGICFCILEKKLMNIYKFGHTYKFLRIEFTKNENKY